MLFIKNKQNRGKTLIRKSFNFNSSAGNNLTIKIRALSQNKMTKIMYPICIMKCQLKIDIKEEI